MKLRKMFICICLLIVSAFLLTNCGDTPQETKPETKAPAMAVKPAPQQVPAPPQMPAVEEPAVDSGPDLLKIKEAALKEQEIILSKKEELEKLASEQTAASIPTQLGDVQKSTQQIASLKQEIQEHMERYSTYLGQLKAGNVDTSEFTLE